MNPDPATLLHHLERARVAPRGEHALEIDVSALSGATEPAPVLLLTDSALYALRSGTRAWQRLPLAQVTWLRVTVDPSGILTRYEVHDSSRTPWLDLALPFARASFRQRLQHVAERLAPKTPTRLALLRARRDAHLVVLAPAFAA